MAILAITNSLLYHAEALADVEALGSDDGIVVDSVAYVEAEKSWYYPDSIAAGSSTWTQLSGGAATLAEVLTAGNFTGGTAIITASDVAATPNTLTFTAGSHTGGGASGFDGGAVAITAGNSNDSSNGDGGAITIDGGNATVGGIGGAISVIAGDSAGNENNGAPVTVMGGSATDGGGGEVTVEGGVGVGTGRSGGNVIVRGGTAGTDGTGGQVQVVGRVGSGAASGGAVTVTAGNSGAGATGDGGAITLTAGDAVATNGSGGDITLNPGDGNGTGTDGEVIVNGKLTVTGMIDPPGVQMTSSASNPGVVAAGNGTIWCRSDSPNVLMFTDDGGTDFVLNSGANATAGTAGQIYENLVLYVDAADRNSYSGTGTAVTDLQGNATNGTLTTATYEEGAFRFDGTTGDLSFTKGASLDNLFDGGGTVIVFFRPDSDGENSEGRLVDTSDSLDEGWWIAAVGDTSGAQQLRFQRNFDGSTGGTWTIDLVTDPITGATVRPVLIGPWSCVAVAYDDSSTANDPTFYLNAFTAAFTENTAPVGNPVSDAGNELVVGNRTADDRTYDGDVGVVLMFDRTLSAVEVQEVFNTFATRYGLGARGIDSTTLNAQRIVIAGGIGSGTTGGPSITDGGDVYILGGDQTSTSGGRGGDLFIRGGDKTGTGNERGGNVVIRSGSGNITSEIHLYAGNLGTNPGSAQSVFIHGADSTTTGAPGGVLVRGGNAVDTGSNRSGGIVAVTGGLGDSIGGDVFIRGGGTIHASAGGTGDITISTGRNGTGGNDTDTGDILITTTDTGSAASHPGDITISCGTANAVSGNESANLSLSAGAMTATGQSFIGGGFVAISAGNSSGNNTSPGGPITISGGDQAGTGTSTNSPGGHIDILAGDSGKSASTSPGGRVRLYAGDGTGTNSYGGVIEIEAGLATGTGGAGTVTITAGAGGSTTAGGAITIAGGVGGSTSGAGGGTTVRGGAGSAGGADGGQLSLFGGMANTSGTGGDVSVGGGNPGTTGNGGGVSIFGAAGGSTSGNGGAITLNGGDVNSGTPGAVTVTGGDSTGSDDGASVTISGGDSGTGTPGSVELRTTEETASVNVRTQSTFTGTVHEHFTFGDQVTLGAGATQTNLVTLGTIGAVGRNMKFEVYVTGVDNGSTGDVNSHRFIQTYFRTGASVTALTAHLSDGQNSGGAGNFAADVTYNLLISGNDIILRAFNVSSTTSYTANICVWWNRQEGGFAS